MYVLMLQNDWKQFITHAWALWTYLCITFFSWGTFIFLVVQGIQLSVMNRSSIFNACVYTLEQLKTIHYAVPSPVYIHVYHPVLLECLHRLSGIEHPIERNELVWHLECICLCSRMTENIWQCSPQPWVGTCVPSCPPGVLGPSQRDRVYNWA